MPAANIDKPDMDFTGKIEYFSTYKSLVWTDNKLLRNPHERKARRRQR